MLLTRTWRPLFFVLLASAVAGIACLRALDTPDPWPCGDDGDCEGGQVCFRASSGNGKCRSADYCELGADCADAGACIDYACVPTLHPDGAACRTDQECKSGKCEAENCVP